MKRLLIISILSFVAVAACVETAEAQLITDSDKRLKTAKKEKKGFLFGLFNKDGRSEGPPRQQVKAGAPRSSGSPFASFKKASVSPKYTEIDRGSLFRSKRTAPSSYASGPPAFNDVFSGPPRYSMGSPFSNKGKTVTPRFSPGSPFSKSSYAAYPRYSEGPIFDQKAMPVLPPRSVSGRSPFSGKFQFVQPRYSPGSPFDNKRITVTPRSISGAPPFSAKDMTVNPRYSPGSPFSKSKFQVSPRYSSPIRFSKQDIAVSPRYSSPMRFSKQDMAVSPRYSSPMRFSKKDMAVNPRYSIPLRFSKRDLAARSPRYSSPMSFSKKDLAVNPRYSNPHRFSKKDNAVNPRYSAGLQFSRKDLAVSTRYSKERDLTLRKKKVSPRFSTNDDRFAYESSKKHAASEGTAFEGSHKKKRDWYQNLDDLSGTWKSAHFKGPTKVPYVSKENFKDNSRESSSFEGNFKQKWIDNHEMHPSFAHHRADNTGELYAESMRKWNIFWARINGNKAQPNAVKEKVSKPKFDRKETEIWND